tara:strand:+ start:23 stop:184 length:162 start_codon:yes stop_codon:yes gene_type:complete
MGQCVTISVGNTGNAVTPESSGTNISNNMGGEEEEEEEDECTDCLPENCFPCI